MGQVLHGCATTTEAVRRAIQHSQESLRALARHSEALGSFDAFVFETDFRKESDRIWALRATSRPQ